MEKIIVAAGSGIEMAGGGTLTTQKVNFIEFSFIRNMIMTGLIDQISVQW